jgi:hypothetical protein
MRILLIACACFLLLAITNLPIGYFTFLRIVVTICSVIVVVKDAEKGINLWVISFGITAIIFNPLVPVYLQDKSIWIPIDIASAVLFFSKAFSK